MHCTSLADSYLKGKHEVRKRIATDVIAVSSLHVSRFARIDICQRNGFGFMIEALEKKMK